jgi:hypothetical protein
MALTGKTPGASYKDLLEIDNSNSGVDATLRSVKGGGGNATKIKVSTTETTIEGTGTDSIQIGNGASAVAADAVVIGSSAEVLSASSGGSIAIGDGATVTGTAASSIAIGKNANSDEDYSNCFGSGSFATANALAVGRDSKAYAQSSTVIGASAESKLSQRNTMAIGYKAHAITEGEMAFSSAASTASPFNGVSDDEYSYGTMFHGIAAEVASTSTLEVTWTEYSDTTISIPSNTGFAFSLFVSAHGKPTGTSTYSSDLFAIWKFDNIFIFNNSGSIQMPVSGGTDSGGDTGGLGDLGDWANPTAYGGGDSANWQMRIDTGGGGIVINFQDSNGTGDYDIVVRASLSGHRYINEGDW